MPPNSQKEYPLSVETWIEEEMHFTVEFKNEDPCKESIVYHVTIRGQASGQNDECVSMESVVRSATSTKIPIRNPLAREIPVTITCPHPQAPLT